VFSNETRTTRAYGMDEEAGPAMQRFADLISAQSGLMRLLFLQDIRNVRTRVMRHHRTAEGREPRC